MNGVPPEGTVTVRETRDGAWVISSCADARAILVSAAARVPADSPPPLRSGGGAADAIVERGVRLRGLWMWGCDADRRPVRRKAGAAALGPGSIEPLIPYLESRAADLLDAGGHASEIDLVAGFARPLVRDALMELLGIAPAARAALDAQVGAMAGFIPGCDSGGTARYFALAATAKALEDLWRRPLPPLAAASRILRGAVEAGELSLDEALAQATLLLFGNSYTTLDALAGLLARLAGQPTPLAGGAERRAPRRRLVEEGLRLGPPAHLVLLARRRRGDPMPGGDHPRRRQDRPSARPPESRSRLLRARRRVRAGPFGPTAPRLRRRAAHVRRPSSGARRHPHRGRGAAPPAAGMAGRNPGQPGARHTRRLQRRRPVRAGRSAPAVLILNGLRIATGRR